MLWKDKYLLGVTLIDNQHRELFDRVEAFMITLRAPVSWEKKVKSVNETLAFMKAYVVEHFHDEEQYQQSIGYPGFEAHRKLHNDMVRYVLDVEKQYQQSGFDQTLMQQFGGRLLAWLINHVAAEDVHVADFARKKGVAGDE